MWKRPTLKAHAYVSAAGLKKDIVLLTFGTREANLARIEDAYAASGCKLVGNEMVQTR